MRTVQEPGHLERNGALSENRLIVDVQSMKIQLIVGTSLWKKQN